MQISNDDLARMLGRIEAKLEAQVASSQRLEGAVAGLDKKLSERADAHERRIRALEIANPKQQRDTLAGHEQRLRALERGTAKAGAIAGVGSSIGIAVILELLKRKLGL